MDDGAGGEDLGVEELDGAGAAGRNKGSPPPLMTGQVQIRYSSSRPAAARASVSWPVPQMRMSPPWACFSRLTSSSRSGPAMTTVGSHVVVSTGWEATNYLVIELTWSAKGLPPLVDQACAMPS